LSEFLLNLENDIARADRVKARPDWAGTWHPPGFNREAMKSSPPPWRTDLELGIRTRAPRFNPTNNSRGGEASADVPHLGLRSPPSSRFVRGRWTCNESFYFRAIGILTSAKPSVSATSRAEQVRAGFLHQPSGGFFRTAGRWR